jgi:hypothetical protein
MAFPQFKSIHHPTLKAQNANVAAAGNPQIVSSGNDTAQAKLIFWQRGFQGQADWMCAAPFSGAILPGVCR